MERKQRKTESVSPLPPKTEIFCEGAKTEPHYLREIVNLINKRCSEYAKSQRIKLRDHIKIIGAGRSTTSLMSFAVDNVDRDTSIVWLVYDKDDFPEDQFDIMPTLAEKRSQSGETRYSIAWSNECFELWLLLHFIPLEAQISRDQYIKKLKDDYVPNYHKSMPDVFDQLRNRVQTAIDHAIKLEEKYGEIPLSQRNPGTNMHELVKELMEYID